MVEIPKVRIVNVSFLRHILRLFVVILFAALGASMAFAAPMNTTEISFYQAENTLLTQHQDAGFAACAPPLAVTNVTVTGGVTVMQGSAFALHGQETVAALFGFGADHIAPKGGPRAPRVDVSDDLVPTRNQNVDAQYRYRDPDSGHGIEVTVDNGALSIDVAARGDASALGSGTDMFNSAMLRLQRDGVEVDRIQGIWIPGTGSDNSAQFNSNIAAGMTRSEAVQNTWTGRISASHGFTEVVETTRPGSSVIDFDFVRP